MKVAHSDYQPDQAGKVLHPYLTLIWSRDASRAQGPEARKIAEALENIQRKMWQRVQEIQSIEALSYNHIAPKPVFSVKCRYKFIGEMKPRHFPIDE